MFLFKKKIHKKRKERYCGEKADKKGEGENGGFRQNIVVNMLK